MSPEFVAALIVITAAGAGLMAGFFLAFSACVMAALARRPAAQAIAAMQSINVTVLNPLFFTAFFGTAIGCIVLLLFSLLSRDTPGSMLLAAGSLCYLIGAIFVTIACNVPRNDRLAAVDPASTQGADLWIAYLAGWTRWNHVRTAASLAAAVAFILASSQNPLF